jgi:hypothetical protein
VNYAPRSPVNVYILDKTKLPAIQELKHVLRAFPPILPAFWLSPHVVKEGLAIYVIHIFGFSVIASIAVSSVVHPYRV